MRLRLLGIVVVLFALLPVAPASAGGWWSSVHVGSRFVAVGDTVTARSEAWWDTTAKAEAAAQGPYYAYLVTEYDTEVLDRAMGRANPTRWWKLAAGTELVRLGRVRVSELDGNLGTARARFTIPRVRPGRYSLMFCDAGCATPLGRVIPTPVRLTADPVAAHAATRVDALGRRLEAGAFAMRERVADAADQAAEARSAATATRRTLNGLTQRVAALEAAAEEEEVAAAARLPWPWIVALGLGLVAFAALVARALRDPSGVPRTSTG